MVNDLPREIREKEVAICWLRRDLRLQDQTALYKALRSGYPVLLLFIFDSDILNRLPDRKDRRVTFIYEHLLRLNRELEEFHASLLVLHGRPLQVFEDLVKQVNIRAVFTNRDYEPYAIRRDQEVEEFLQNRQIAFNSYKDQVIFEGAEILKPDGSPYTVYTPYSKKWREKYHTNPPSESPSEAHLDKLQHVPQLRIMELEEIGFQKADMAISDPLLDAGLISSYHKTRDIPGISGTTRAGVHLRFGTYSVRKLVSLARQWNEVWLNELIWREFFMMILYHFPQVVDQNFRRKYDRLQWRNNEAEFERWRRGETGYALVDAGMRELNQTGWMHNRVRMVTAGFLTKHLLIDWRWGEAYFAEKLLDYELASNNGNWQWAAGTGCDSAPYFRIFNPITQLQKFDPDLKYVKKWIPNYKEGYLAPVVEHKMARERALETYKRALS